MRATAVDGLNKCPGIRQLSGEMKHSMFVVVSRHLFFFVFFSRTQFCRSLVKEPLRYAKDTASRMHM